MSFKSILLLGIMAIVGLIGLAATREYFGAQHSKVAAVIDMDPAERDILARQMAARDPQFNKVRNDLIAEREAIQDSWEASHDGRGSAPDNDTAAWQGE